MPDKHQSELEKLRTIVAELTSLNDIAKAINTSLSVEKITEIMIDNSLNHLNADQGAIFLLEADKSKSNQFVTFIRKTTELQEGMPIHLNMNLTGWMIQHKKLLVINDLEKDNPFTRLDLKSLGISSLLVAPLLTRNGLIGVVAMFNKKGGGGFTDQDSRFVEILSSQCSHVIEAARLYEEEKRLTALRDELQVARSIQKSLLPGPQSFSNPNKVYGFNESAREVGGDFFDIRTLSDGTIFVAIGDVVGKGVPAALLMSNAVAVIRAHLSKPGIFSLQDLTSNLNYTLCQFNSPGQFITVFLGVFDPANQLFTFVNAGHSHPIIVSNGRLVPCPHESDLVVGVLSDAEYKVHSVQLPNDSTLCIFTDGVTEAFNEKDEQYSERRLVSLLRSISSESAKEICNKLLISVQEFRGVADQSDDITAVVLKN